MGARLTRIDPAIDSDEYLRRWSALHGGAATAGLVGWWLKISYRFAAPLARTGVGPDTVTVLGLGVAAAAVVPTRAGGRWLLLTVVLIGLSGLLDNLDGAVAVLGGRATRWGAVLDAACDRIADALYAAVLWRLGAPGALAVATAAIGWLHEYVRARAVAAGMSDVGVVSVSERPTRVIVTVMFVLGCAVYPGSAAGWATGGAAVGTAVGSIGLVQVVRVVRLRLR